MDSMQGTLCPGRRMAGHVSFACHAKETVSHPKDNGKPLKGFKLGNDFFYDRSLSFLPLSLPACHTNIFSRTSDSWSLSLLGWGLFKLITHQTGLSKNEQHHLLLPCQRKCWEDRKSLNCFILTHWEEVAGGDRKQWRFSVTLPVPGPCCGLYEGAGLYPCPIQEPLFLPSFLS